MTGAEWIPIITKLIGLAANLHSSIGDKKFDDKDLRSLSAALDAGGTAVALRKSPELMLEARQLALVSTAFGRAWRLHWDNYDKYLKTQKKSFEERFTEASLKDALTTANPTRVEELQQIAELTQNPLGSRFYKLLWDTFTETKLTEHGDEQMLDPSRRLFFERYFLQEYWIALRGPLGQPLLDAQPDLKQRQAQLVREFLASNLRTWSQRHVFSNLEPNSPELQENIPFLPLEKMYVEPNAEMYPEEEAAPILEILERLLQDPKATKPIVVRAHFGNGKSLTARTLAQKLATRYLEAPAATTELYYPIFIRCADDFPDESFDLEKTVHNATLRQAKQAGLSLDAEEDKDALQLPDAPHKIVYFLDGLDEVTLGEQKLKSLFNRLTNTKGSRHRFIIFTRPEALPLPEFLDRHSTRILDLLPLNKKQIANWLARWNGIVQSWNTTHLPMNHFAPMTYGQLEQRPELLEIAQTPILLFMIAYGWKSFSSQLTPPTRAEIYEGFFWQIAKGKHELDQKLEKNANVLDACEKLHKKISPAEVHEEAETQAAMLWLMSRVAWEAHKLEQKNPPKPLTRSNIERILSDLGIEARDSIATIQVGLLLALQADLQTSAQQQLLFGHKSFREFLVARYWAHQLRKIIKANRNQISKEEAKLFGGQLVLPGEDQSFTFLMQIINSEQPRKYLGSPLGWSDAERSKLVQWAQECFENQDQEFAQNENPNSRQLQDDQRALLRHAALAIGSLTKDSPGIRAEDPVCLRSMLAWFWVSNKATCVTAPKANFSNQMLNGANLNRANLNRANLNRAKLARANLNHANLNHAHLNHANLNHANLNHAHLTGAHLKNANLNGANLNDANLNDANLNHAYLNDAHLNGTYLNGANLSDANLNNTDLTYTNLSNADLSGATFDKSTYNLHTEFPEGFDPEAAGMIHVEHRMMSEDREDHNEDPQPTEPQEEP